MRSNGPEGGGQDARHKLPGIKQVKSPSCRMGFLRFCRPASVPACPPVALRLPGPRILGHLLAEGTSMPQSYRRQS
ncbi:hypothetical protein [Klebsiella pneumoniae]|uniref:hypothetical protein n=1 Tax=Klebsiella pneumoniae TaxID=573 RepID=UPI001157C3E8|nr:hypothetical protein [Klebsiella pneumoniae]MDF2249158.1 hypothetical protein [Klebsiella pneumoniae]